MPYYDFRIEEDAEAINGDIIQEIGDIQNAQDIILAGPGNYFTSPMVGVAIVTQVNSELSLVERESRIRAHLKRDGFTITYFEHFLDDDGNYETDLRAEK